MPAWPATVPSTPLAGSLQIKTDDVTVSFQPDVGPSLRRRRYTAVSRKYVFNLMLTTAELLALDTFFESDCEDGALTFTMIDPATNISNTWHWDAPIERQPTFKTDHWLISVALTRQAS